MTGQRFVDCKCGHPRALHPARTEEACIDPGCDCVEYVPATIDQLIPSPGVRLAPVARVEPQPAAPAPSFEQVIAAGKRSSAKRTVAAAERIESLLIQLRDRIHVEAEVAEERRRRDAAAEQARLEIERLQRELAAAKAKLHPRTPPGTKSTPEPGDGTCPDCGKPGLTAVGAHRAKAHGYRRAG